MNSNPTSVSSPKKTISNLEEVVRLVRDATRVEMWSLEMALELNKVPARKAEAKTMGDLAENLSASLDRQPVHLDGIRTSLCALAPVMEKTFNEMPPQAERLRVGVAAAITYAKWYANQIIQVQAPTKSFAGVAVNRDALLPELKPGASQAKHQG